MNLKFFDKKGFGSIFKIFLSSIILVFSFYSIPSFINYSKYKSSEYKNNSKAVLAYTLNNKSNKQPENNDFLDENDLLRDIFSLNDLETDTVRLNASTIKQLFEDTNYTLDDVRKKLVKPVALTLLPGEIKMIENTNQRKSFLFRLSCH